VQVSDINYFKFNSKTNSTVIITYSRQSLNQILIMENVNVLKSQSGISSASIHEGYFLIDFSIN